MIYCRFVTIEKKRQVSFLGSLLFSLGIHYLRTYIVGATF